MKWFFAFLLMLSYVGLSAQEFSVGAGGLWSWSSSYVETVETLNNSVRHVVDETTGDSVYLLTLLQLINEDEHIFKAKPGWQFQANFDWNFSKKMSLQTGVGFRGRKWEYNAKPTRFIFYETLVGEIPEEEAPVFTETLVCDQVINNEGAYSASEFADVSTLDLIVPLGIQVAFSDKLDVGLSAVFSAPLKSTIASEYTSTEFYMSNGEQICENSLATAEDVSGDFFRKTRWSTELSFTYWINNIGIQAMVQTSTAPLMKRLGENGPIEGQIVTTDTFKPRFLGLLVKYRFGKVASEN